MNKTGIEKSLLAVSLCAGMLISAGCSPGKAGNVADDQKSIVQSNDSLLSENESSIKAAEGGTQSGSGADNSVSEKELSDGNIHTPLKSVGSVYISENKAFTPYYFDTGSGDAYSEMLNIVSERLGPDVKTYSILAPTSFAVCLGQEIQDSMGCSDESAAIEYTYSLINENVTPVCVMEPMKKHNAEYLFFGTDHHWTQLGAYYAYREWCEQAGKKPHELSYFQYASYPDFLGLFYSYSDYSEELASNPDTVEAWIPAGTNEMTVTGSDGYEYTHNIVTDVSASDAGTKYSAFIGGDTALCSIYNPNITDGSACLLIKDSFGNAFAPFLVDHYENVYVVDYRYYTDDLTAFAREKGVNDVIILTNVDEILQSTSEQIKALFA